MPATVYKACHLHETNLLIAIYLEAGNTSSCIQFYLLDHNTLNLPKGHVTTNFQTSS